MALKKSELYSSLWASCDALRGGMDASQYKDYVLVLLFIKYVSDRYAGQPFAPITIPEGASFADMVALKGKPDIGDQINKRIVGPLANANKLSDMPDFNDPVKLGSGKEMVERLTNLIGIFEDKRLDFSKNRADGDDILGDAYEYLMRHFATESGKSKGQFYTPAEVSRIIAQILGVRTARTSPNTTVYDPACGSGSLLLKVADEAPTKLTLYGQEKDAATSGLARMNMILHDNPEALIQQGNTLTDPKFKDGETLKQFDYVVANPPFSDKRWSTGLDASKDPFERFQSFGVPPAKQGDYAYLLHIVRSLKSTGKGACILPHGVLFRGNAEAEIRRNLVRKGYIKGIIGLPPNLFYGTGIPACIVVVDKEGAAARKGIFLIDASGGFMKDGPKNRLRAQDIHRIVDVFTRQTDAPRFARMVPFAEIEKNEFNLNLPRYIDSQTPEDIQDIAGHLQGGIPVRDIDALASYWTVCPSLRASLFRELRAGYLTLLVDKSAIKATIYEHPEFKTFIAGMSAHFEIWRATAAGEHSAGTAQKKRAVREGTIQSLSTDRTEELRRHVTQAGLRTLGVGCHPKQVIADLAEGLLSHYHGRPLIDAYAVYQHLMDYWAETMQDDCYLIAADGWKAETYRIIETKPAKGDKPARQVDKGWACDLVPKQLVVSRYFGTDQAAIDDLTAKLDATTAKLATLEEEHGGEEGVLAGLSTQKDVEAALTECVFSAWEQIEPDKHVRWLRTTAEISQWETRQAELEETEHVKSLLNDKGRITKAAITKRLRSADSEQETTVLRDYLDLGSKINEGDTTVKELEQAAEKDVQDALDKDASNEALADLRVINAWLAVSKEIADLKSRIRAAEEALDAAAYAKYPTLNEDEVKALVVDDKWLATLDARIHGEMDRVSQQLTTRVRELAERYDTTLPTLTELSTKLESKVNAHLERMGYSWK